MIRKISSVIRIFEENHPLMQLLGPLSLLCTLMIAATAQIFAYDLLAIGAIGLFLCARWKIRGCAYALAFLAISAVTRHLFLTDRHAIAFGVEISVAFALLISSLSFEEGSAWVATLTGKIDAKEQTIRNLEEEILRMQEQVSTDQISASDKIASLSQTIDEIQSESAALHILNEVLRKSTAKALEEKENQERRAVEAEVAAADLFSRCSDLDQKVARLSDGNELAEQNKQLFSELNAARVKEAQTHLINETVVRMHAKENQRAKELEAAKSLLEQQREELERKLSFALRDAEMNRAQAEQLMQRFHQLQEEAKALEPLQTERNFLRERLEELEAELRLKKDKLESLESSAETSAALSKGEAAALIAERDHLIVQMQELRSHLSQYARSESLYRQLKEQFEEKNKILHETRAQLFHAETQVQTARMELKQKEIEEELIPAPVREEVEGLEAEADRLMEENLLLQDLVTHLIQEPAPAVKKKVIKKAPLPEQDLLF